MIVTIRTSGGVANVVRTRTVDSATLAPDEAVKLEAEVAAADLHNLPRVQAGASGGADRLHYDITVEANGERWAAQAEEGSAPDSLLQPIDHVHRLARKRKSS